MYFPKFHSDRNLGGLMKWFLDFLCFEFKNINLPRKITISVLNFGKISKYLLDGLMEIKFSAVICLSEYSVFFFLSDLTYFYERFLQPNIILSIAVLTNR